VQTFGGLLLELRSKRVALDITSQAGIHERQGHAGHDDDRPENYRDSSPRPSPTGTHAALSMEKELGRTI
jgi:hypothetical protein